MKSPYAVRTCLICERRFQPGSPNQRTCRKCKPKRRKFYDRNYQRKERRKMKQSLAELQALEDHG